MGCNCSPFLHFPFHWRASPCGLATIWQRISTLCAAQLQACWPRPAASRAGHGSLRLRHSGIPFVFVFRDIPEIQTDLVACDNVQASYEAIGHLIGLGHRRIVMIVRDATVPTHQQWLQGFRRAMSEANLEIDEGLIFSAASSHHRKTSPWTPGAAYGICLRLARLRDRPTAVFVTQDFFALGAYHAFADCQMWIPYDVSIVSYGDTDLAPHFVPPLTSVGTGKTRIGTAALNLLLHRIRELEAIASPSKILVPPKLIVRGSTDKKYES